MATAKFKQRALVVVINIQPTVNSIYKTCPVTVKVSGTNVHSACRFNFRMRPASAEFQVQFYRDWCWSKIIFDLIFCVSVIMHWYGAAYTTAWSGGSVMPRFFGLPVSACGTFYEQSVCKIYYRVYRVRQKSEPLKFFAVFSATVWNFN